MTEPELVDPPEDRPVFVDASGRRRRVLRRVAVVFVSAIATVAGILVAALLGAPVVPTALLPAPHVSTSPTPASQRARPPTHSTAVAAPPAVRAPATSDTVAKAAEQVVTTSSGPTAATSRPVAPATTTTQHGNPTHGTGNKPTGLPTPTTHPGSSGHRR
jgi:hypothetical protein